MVTITPRNPTEGTDAVVGGMSGKEKGLRKPRMEVIVALRQRLRLFPTLKHARLVLIRAFSTSPNAWSQ